MTRLDDEVLLAVDGSWNSRRSSSAIRDVVVLRCFWNSSRGAWDWVYDGCDTLGRAYRAAPLLGLSLLGAVESYATVHLRSVHARMTTLDHKYKSASAHGLNSWLSACLENAAKQATVFTFRNHSVKLLLMRS